MWLELAQVWLELVQVWLELAQVWLDSSRRPRRFEIIVVDFGNVFVSVVGTPWRQLT